MLKAVTNSLLALIYPQECLVCRRSVENADDGIACAMCWEQTRFFDGSETLCSKCGAYTGANSGATASTCRECTDHAFEFAMAVGIYEKALASAVLNLKHEPFLPRRLKMIFAETSDHPAFSDCDIVIPVPLHQRRLKERGFNQAAVLSAIISGRSKAKLDESSLIRTKHTPPHRAAMSRNAREKKVGNAFEVTRPKLIEGASVLLVDDVLTTGATASNCARTLIENGAAKVKVLTLARAVLRRPR